MKVNTWLWNSVQEDLIMLQNEYKKLGYDLTIKQCYEAWYLYSEGCCANWLSISNVENSIEDVKKIINNN